MSSNTISGDSIGNTLGGTVQFGGSQNLGTQGNNNNQGEEGNDQGKKEETLTVTVKEKTPSHPNYGRGEKCGFTLNSYFEGASLTLSPGQKLTLKVNYNYEHHPLIITPSAVGGFGVTPDKLKSGQIYCKGVVYKMKEKSIQCGKELDNGDVEAVIIDVDEFTNNNLHQLPNSDYRYGYYQCSRHSYMGGIMFVKPESKSKGGSEGDSKGESESKEEESGSEGGGGEGSEGGDEGGTSES